MSVQYSLFFMGKNLEVVRVCSLKA